MADLEKGRPGTLIVFGKEWWPSAMSALGAAGLALPGLAGTDGRLAFIPGEPDRLKVFLIGLALTLVGGVALSARNKRGTVLEQKLQQSSALAEERLQQLTAFVRQASETVQSLCRMELGLLARRLRYYSNERVSLYAPAGDHFVLVARCSLGPAFQTPGREKYPLDQGCLGQAWERGRSAEANLSDPIARPAQWRDEMRRRCNVPPSVSENLKMKSRTYVAFRIDGGTGSDPLGVVVFESLNALDEINLRDEHHRCIMNPDELAEIVAGEEASRLQGLLQRAARFMPPQEAVPTAIGVSTHTTRC
jgi:hypothetical protein